MEVKGTYMPPKQHPNTPEGKSDGTERRNTRFNANGWRPQYPLSAMDSPTGQESDREREAHTTLQTANKPGLTDS